MMDFDSWSYGYSGVSDAGVWLIISLVVAIIGGIAVYFTFMSKKNENSFTGFLAKLYDFLNFKTFFAEVLLKIIYLVVAIYITLSSFALIGTSFLAFVGTLVFGNLIARLSFEFMLVLLTICKNTTEINKKMKKADK